MKKVLAPACIIAVIILTACGENGSGYQNYNAEAKPITFNTSPVGANSSKSIFANTNKATPSANATPVYPEIPIAAAATTGAVNPAHGQPGHRCDIAVGAPLNPAAKQAQQIVPVAAATPSAPVQQSVPVTAPSLPDQPTPAPTVSTTGKLNPAHGQPGHRCDISVGAPLSSAVKQVQQTASVASVQATPAPKTGTAAGGKINPAHGKPGHRCDIAVGASLNSPVKQEQSKAQPQQPEVQQPVPVQQQPAPSTQMFPSLPKGE